MNFRGYITLAFIVTLFAGLFFASPFLQDIFFIVAEDVGSFASGNAGLVIVLFVLLATISALVSPFSSVPIVPVAVALWGPWLTSAFLLLGWLFGDTLAYAIGRYAGHSIVRQFIREEKLRGYERYFSERMTFLRALLIRLALPAEIGYGFGLIRYHLGAYFLVTFITEGLFAFITVQASDALINLKTVAFLGWAAVLITLIGAAYFFFHKGRKLR